MSTSEEFEALLACHRIAVERYVTYRMPSIHDADDVIQETYIAAFTHFDELRAREQFLPWILSIARNECRRFYKQQVHRAYVALEAAAEIADEAGQPDDETVRQILSCLPPQYAEVLRYTVDGYKQSEIAEICNVPVGTVKSRLYHARRLFRGLCPPEILNYYESEKKAMKTNQYTKNFPERMPDITITKKEAPFFEVRCEEQAFLIPRVGNVNSEGTYRYPNRALALVSTCRAAKDAVVHGVPCVKIVRDTYNVGAGKLYEREGLWFTQLTDSHIRNIAEIKFDNDDDDDGNYPTEIWTFLDTEYDGIVNGNDRVNGMPILITEHPATIAADGEVLLDAYNERFTKGVYEVKIGERTFETVCCVSCQENTTFSETYIDRNGRCVLMRLYESQDSIDENDNYTDAFRVRIRDNDTVTVNGTRYILIADRISEYAL